MVRTSRLCLETLVSRSFCYVRGVRPVCVIHMLLLVRYGLCVSVCVVSSASETLWYVPCVTTRLYGPCFTVPLS